MIIAFDYAVFKCPSCSEKIYVRTIEGQGFGDRLEKPKPFFCPNCHAEVVFHRRPGRMFQFGMVMAIFIAPAFLFFGRFSITYTLMFVGLGIAAVGMLTQNLIVYDNEKR